MKTRLPIALVLVAVLQFLGPLALPPQMLAGISPLFWGIIGLLFAVLGVNLLRRKAWSRVATIFVQGFNVIVRILVLPANAVQGDEIGGAINMALLIACAVSFVISGIILYYVDQPDVQMIMA